MYRLSVVTAISGMYWEVQMRTNLTLNLNNVKIITTCTVHSDHAVVDHHVPGTWIHIIEEISWVDDQDFGSEITYSNLLLKDRMLGIKLAPGDRFTLDERDCPNGSLQLQVTVMRGSDFEGNPRYTIELLKLCGTLTPPEEIPVVIEE